MLLACPVLTMVGLLLLSTLTVGTSIWVIGAFLFILGAGIGLGIQNLVLVVQSAFSASEVGTATAANNFFREIGASLGAAVVGGFFTSRLTGLLGDRLPDSATSSVDVDSLTPQVLRDLPDSLRVPITGAYNDALTPVFLFLVPLMVVSLVLMIFVREDSLTGDPGTDVARDPALDDHPAPPLERLPSA